MKTIGMHRVSWLKMSAVLVSVLSFLPSTLLAGQAAEPLAKLNASEGMVTFEPLIEHSAMRVTMSGPEGFAIIKSFAAGDLAEIDLPGVDGFYKYELRFSPALDEESLATLAAVRKSGDELAADLLQERQNMVQSGSFSIAEGSVVGDFPETPDKVVLTNGDGVIRNSLCVGFDCPDAPAFDDSTILMMENNTRIKFADTSNSPFPNNDWEIEANSTTSGGASYLGFNDCGSADNDGGCATDLVFAVESGARQSALYVESDGDIGIGTSNPVVDLHIVTGNSPAIRLDQDGSSGFTPQVWDIAGNETNFFIRDVTSGSRLPFRIRPGAGTNSIFIDSDGDVGISTAAPSGRLHIAGNVTNEPELFIGSTSGAAVTWRVQANTGTGRLTFTDDATGARVPFKFDPSANNNLLRVGVAAANTVDINGVLSVVGSVVVDGVTVHPDYVFDPAYKLDSVAEHAAKMWEAGHLPALPRAPESGSGPVELVSHQMGMLEELEKAHIYIEQLHHNMEEMKTANDKLVERVLALEQKLAE